MPRRTDARRQVLQMLYLIDQNPDADRHRIHASVRKELRSAGLVEFALELLEGVCAHRTELDDMIRGTAINWRLERMAPTDRNVLRMGIYEMQFMGTPAPVVLNEAIEIARDFGTEQSGGFVNGILDRLTTRPATAGAAAAVQPAASVATAELEPDSVEPSPSHQDG